MKSTGIVRRVDDLGRIIIPKEIRRTLRLHDGDPMEIFVTDGGVFFKKYSPLEDLKEFAQKYADTLYYTSGLICIITDRNNVIALTGHSRMDYIEKAISKELEEIIEKREIYTVIDNTVPIIANDNNPFYAQIIAPIICDGDIAGSVILLTQDTNSGMGIVERKLAETGAKFLGKALED
jgi:AbrB family transcriptional regulator (stage V sporulation protein T)